MKNPCLACELLEQCKNNERCENCRARLDYLEFIQTGVVPRKRAYDMPIKIDSREAVPPMEENVPVKPAPPKVQRKGKGLSGITKKCNTCGETKPINEYHANYTCRGGFEARCIACKKKGLRARKAAKESGSALKKGSKQGRKPVAGKAPETFLSLNKTLNAA